MQTQMSNRDGNKTMNVVHNIITDKYPKVYRKFSRQSLISNQDLEQIIEKKEIENEYTSSEMMMS